MFQPPPPPTCPGPYPDDCSDGFAPFGTSPSSNALRRSGLTDGCSSSPAFAVRLQLLNVSMRIDIGLSNFNDCSGAFSLPSNVLSQLCPTFKQQQLLQDPIRSSITSWAASHPLALWMATLLTGGFFNYIHCRSVMFLQDAALDLNKPTLCEAPPQRHHASETTPFAVVRRRPTHRRCLWISLPEGHCCNLAFC
jgi:hypothetical protein